MFNLSPRWKKVISSTPENIGPLTYLICDSSHKRVNCVPFASTQKRLASDRKPVCDNFYDTPRPPKIKGGSALKNKGKRFVYREEDTPGPGQYDITSYCKKCPLVDPTPPKGKGRVYLCRTKFTFGVSAPTIPTRIDENGYELDVHGDLIKIPPNAINKAIGPMSYNIEKYPCCGCERYRGNRWSKSKTNRWASKIECTPGPGAYDLEKPKNAIAERDEKYREMARLFSFLPRYIESQQIKIMKEELPGPFDYYPQPIKCKKSRVLASAPFNATSKRFKESTEVTPGPTDYNTDSKKRSRVKCCPIVGPPRFSHKKQIITPGPASYYIKSPMQSKLDSKINKYARVHAPFNQTAVRDLDRDVKEVTPSSADYVLPSGNYCKRTVGSSTFKSKVDRFPKLRCEGKEPVKVNVISAFAKTQCQKSFNASKPSFNVKFVKIDRIPEGPGPGDYDVASLTWNDGRTVPRKYPRFPDDDECLPGPGTFWIHPAYDVSTYKAWSTHNIKLKEHVLRKKLLVGPKDTYKAWCEELKKKKRLKWFKNKSAM